MKDEQVSQYIHNQPADIQKRLTAIRNLIFELVPDAQEYISYGMPAYKVNKKILIYYMVHSKHIGMYPGRIENYDFSERVKQYASGKSTLQFKNDQPLPLDIIKELLLHRLAQAKG